MVPRLKCTRVHFVQVSVSVSVSRPKKVLTTTLQIMFIVLLLKRDASKMVSRVLNVSDRINCH